MKINEKIIIFICALCLAIFILVTAIVSTAKAIRYMDYDIAQQKSCNSNLQKELQSYSKESVPAIDSIVSSYIAELNAIGLSVENYQMKKGKEPTAEFNFSCDEKHFQCFVNEFPNMLSSRSISFISINSMNNMFVVKSTLTGKLGRIHVEKDFHEIPSTLFFTNDKVVSKQDGGDVARSFGMKITNAEKHAANSNYSVLGYVNGSCYVKDKDGKILILSDL